MWLSVQQLAGFLNITERAVRKAIEEERYSLKRQIPGRGRGGKAWQISALDPAIPDEIRVALGMTGELEALQKSAKEAQRVGIAPERLDKKTATRLRVLKRASECPSGIALGEWYTHIASAEGISVPTIYRWLAEQEKGKVISDRAPISVALEVDSGPLSIAVKSRSFAPQALEYGLSLLTKHPNLDVKRAYYEMAAEAEKQGWEIGSLASFYRKWGEVPDAVKLYNRAGKRAVELMVKPAIERDLTTYKVYEVLCGDQHIFDYTVFDDDGEYIRPQMFAWVDQRSRYFSGIWPVMGNYDQYAVGLALREACRWGIPESLYTDWGRPERSNYVAYLRKQLSGYTVFGQMDSEDIMPHKKAKPRNAQAKPIESYFFHAFEKALLQKNLPGYSRQDKQDERRNEYLQARLREDIKGKKLLHAKAFFEIVFQVLEDWHSHTIQTDGTQPERCFLEGIQRPLTRFDDRTLDFIFLPAAVRQVRNSVVEMTLPGFGKCRWHASELAILGKRGRKPRVEIRFDPYDPAVVHCLEPESQKLICTAERLEKIDPHDMDVVSHRIRKQNALIRDIRNLSRQMVRPDIKIHKFSPYIGAAAEITEMQAVREQLVVNDADLNRKIINLARSMGMELPKAKAQ